MNIPHTFEVYQKQLDNIRKNNYYGRPQVLRQFRMQFKEFSEYDISTIKSFLADTDKKWFVAHLLDNLDTFPVDLLKPMLIAAVNEPNPSFNNEFIKPCRRVFNYTDAQKILLDIFCNGNTARKKGALKALYWVRPKVHTLTTREGKKIIEKKGYDNFFWDYESQKFNEYFEEDEEVYKTEYPKQEAARKEQIKIILEEFYKTTVLELKYQIALTLPQKVNDYPKELQTEAGIFIKEKDKQGLRGNMSEIKEQQNISSNGLQRIIFRLRGLFIK